MNEELGTDGLCATCRAENEAERLLCWNCNNERQRLEREAERVAIKRADRVHAAARAIETGRTQFMEPEAIAQFAIRLVDAVDAALLAGRPTP